VRGLVAPTLRRRFGSSLRAPSLSDRFLGLTYNEHKWPVLPREQMSARVINVDELASWFLREYVEKADLVTMHRDNPHAAFLWLFLHGYMQGSANRSTAWPTSLRQIPTYLPWASYRILQLTASFQPRHRSYWYGKYPAMVMARKRYGVPQEILTRLDPPAPRLDMLLYETFLTNRGVLDLLSVLAKRNRFERLKGILPSMFLEKSLPNLLAGHVPEGQLVQLFRLCWFLQLEELAWPTSVDTGAYAMTNQSISL